MITFMVDVRHASRSHAGIVGTGYWGGTFVGRLLLGLVTECLGERRSVMILLTLCIGFHLLFWLIPDIIVSAVAVAMLGLVIGPLYPAVINLQSKLLPKRLHITGISFSGACGMSGGGVWPFLIGAMATKNGVQVLQPVILALLGTMGVLWISIPRVHRNALAPISSYECGMVERNVE